MSETVKHTPGPWVYSTIGFNVLTQDRTDSICGVNDHGQEMTLANARLIAAAPDMLEALENLVSLANPHFSDAPEMLALQIAREAICKARGDAA